MSGGSPPTSMTSATSIDSPRRFRPAGHAKTAVGAGASWAIQGVEVALVAAFLALTFLYGCFPVKDTDLWWHLRTGDLIRAEWVIPTTDWYTYNAEGAEWIDLHWGFQILISLGWEVGGIVGLNLAKCLVTVGAVWLLIAARRPEWPRWVMLTAWLPALYMLSGRMYVRPETLTLLWLAAYLAVLFRWRDQPRLMWVLPIVQVAWTNTQGLFALGPFLLAVALIDAALSPGAFAAHRRRWWRDALIVTGLVALACFVNPYGWKGALFPLQLLTTMNDPVFGRHIAELSSIPKLINDAGQGPYPLSGDPVAIAGFLIDRYPNLPFTLQVQIVTILLGAASFALLWWQTLTRRLRAWGRRDAAKLKDKNRKADSRAKAAVGATGRWESLGIQPLRLILFVAFTYLSWKATRNSHQFAAVVGTVTAWNLGQWAGTLLAERPGWRDSLTPRFVALGAILACLGLLVSGTIYRWAGEGRTLGLGEEPMWYPHEAVAFAGAQGMPERFLSFHEGHSALYAYLHGPQRKVDCDARLEVMGPERYSRYVTLKDWITEEAPRWRAELEARRRPAILTDHAMNAATGAVLMTDSDWRCVWFDPIAAVFLHRRDLPRAGVAPVDFAARVFDPSGPHEPTTDPARLALAIGLRNYAGFCKRPGRLDWARPMTVWGSRISRALLDLDPTRIDAWKLLAQFEQLRDESTANLVGSSRSQAPRRPDRPLDPIDDGHSLRAAYALRRALEIAPNDFLSLALLAKLYQDGGLWDAERNVIERLSRLTAINPLQTREIESARARLSELNRLIPNQTPPRWENRDDLERSLERLLASGRAQTAAEWLTQSAPDLTTSWERADLTARLWCRLGNPDQAARIWNAAPDSTPPGLKARRLAMAAFARFDLDMTQAHLNDARTSRPDDFETWWLAALVALDRADGPTALNALTHARDLLPADPRQREQIAFPLEAMLSWVAKAVEPIHK